MTEQSQYLKQLQERLDALQQETYSLNDDLAANPEIGGSEWKTCTKICKLLATHGIATETGFAGQPTAFIGRVKSDPGSPVRIGILTEYDALPEVGHACGHCASGSLSVLTALALHTMELPPCNIDIIGTPDEENLGGKVFMADAGVFDDYSYTIMIHMGSADMNMTHSDSLALTPYLLHFKGQPAHAAGFPWLGRNALNGATLTMHALDMMRQHVKPSSRIHGIIRHGGDAPNVVPESATIDLLLRSPDKYYLQELGRLMRDCAEGAARATQTTVEIEQYGPTFDNMLHIPSGIDALRQIYEEMGIPLSASASDNSDEKLTGSSDVGNVSFRCPSFQPMLSVTDQPLAMHSKEYAALMSTEQTHRAIRSGAEIIGRMVLRSLCDDALIPKMQEEFRARVK